MKSKWISYSLIVIGVFLFLLRFFRLYDQQLGEIEFGDLYQFAMSIFFIGLGMYFLRKKK